MTKMQTDALSRRMRFAKPQPVAERIVVHEGDMAVFDAIRRHGPLPTPYLHAFADSCNKNKNSFQYRLTLHYNGGVETAPLLSRPPEQFRSFKARYQHLIYDLSKASKLLLQERGMRCVIRTEHFVHQIMNACVGASLELACRVPGTRYIHADEILARTQNPLAIKVGGKTIIPDALFGIQYKDGSYRFFAVEVDRSTESIERADLSKNTFGKKLEAYLALLSARTYKDHWGVPNLMVLIVTTNETHKRNLIAHLDKLTDSKLKERFLFKTKQEFGINWEIPPIMTDLLIEPWSRIGEPFDISRP